jgi:hypothetical protein
MILRLKVKKNFKEKDFVNIIEVNKAIHQKIVNKESHLLGRRTRDKVQENISSSIKRPKSTKNLQKSFKYYSFGGLGWAVGLVDYLKTTAPYYLAINYGSRHMVGRKVPKGKFSPGKAQPSAGEFRKGRWNTEGNYAFVVSKPIKPTYYIERTNNWLGKEIRKWVTIINNRFRKEYKK